MLGVREGDDDCDADADGAEIGSDAISGTGILKAVASGLPVLIYGIFRRHPLRCLRWHDSNRNAAVSCP